MNLFANLVKAGEGRHARWRHSSPAARSPEQGRSRRRRPSSGPDRPLAADSRGSRVPQRRGRQHHAGAHHPDQPPRLHHCCLAPPLPQPRAALDWACKAAGGTSRASAPRRLTRAAHLLSTAALASTSSTSSSPTTSGCRPDTASQVAVAPHARPSSCEQVRPATFGSGPAATAAQAGSSGGGGDRSRGC